MKVGDKVQVINDPVRVGSRVAGHSGEIIEIQTHPYGKKYGMTYKVKLPRGDFWFPEDHLELME